MHSIRVTPIVDGNEDLSASSIYNFEDALTFGRASDNAVVINSSYASRKQFEIVPAEEAGHYVISLFSDRVKTILNDEPVEKTLTFTLPATITVGQKVAVYSLEVAGRPLTEEVSVIEEEPRKGFLARVGSVIMTPGRAIKNLLTPRRKNAVVVEQEEKSESVEEPEL